MIVYVETNFVLELSLQQEEYESCAALAGLARERRVELVVPAYSLLEPFHTLRGREQKHDLSAEDACILGAVQIDLEAAATSVSCFLNRNWKDFADPQIIESLSRNNCRLISSFDAGLRFVESETR